MTRRVTFLHAADLHLGAPFRGVRALSRRWADRLLGALAESYDRVIAAALEHKVDFVVIAGDVFDTSRASYTDYLHFFKGLHVLEEAGIPVYLCTGNHDPLTSWKREFFELPSNAYMFAADKPSFTVFERDGEPLVVLGGRSYYNQTWPFDQDISEGITRAAAEEATGAHGAPFAVGVMHSGLHLDPVKAPADPAKLMRDSMDYWALGHIHQRYCQPEEAPKIVFPGCIQGRDIKETGPRGVSLVTLTEDAPNVVEFIPTASVVWQRLRVDVSECESIAEASAAIMHMMFEVNGQSQCEEMCVRIELAGKTKLHRYFADAAVLSDLRKSLNAGYEQFFFDALVDCTEPPLNKEALREEGLFPAAVMTARDKLQRAGEASLAEEQAEFATRGSVLSRVLEDSIETLLAEAENLVLDMLGSSTDANGGAR